MPRCGPLRGEDAHERADAGLGHAVGGSLAHPAVGRDGRDHHDRRALRHVLDGGLAAVEDAVEVEREHVAPGVLGQVHGRADDGDAGGRHQAVDAPALRRDAREGLEQRRAARGVDVDVACRRGGSPRARPPRRRCRRSRRPSPRAANRSAVPSPMPFAPPVTTSVGTRCTSSCRGRARDARRAAAASIASQSSSNPNPGPAGATISPSDRQREARASPSSPNSPPPGTPISTRPRRVQPAIRWRCTSAQKCGKAATPCASAEPTARSHGSTPPSSVASARSRATSPVAAMACSSTTDEQISPTASGGRSAGRPVEALEAELERPRLLDEGDRVARQPRQRLLRVGARPAAVDVEARCGSVSPSACSRRATRGQVALRAAEPAHQLDDSARRPRRPARRRRARPRPGRRRPACSRAPRPRRAPAAARRRAATTRAGPAPVPRRRARRARRRRRRARSGRPSRRCAARRAGRRALRRGRSRPARGAPRGARWRRRRRGRGSARSTRRARPTPWWRARSSTPATPTTSGPTWSGRARGPDGGRPGELYQVDAGRRRHDTAASAPGPAA